MLCRLYVLNHHTGEKRTAQRREDDGFARSSPIGIGYQSRLRNESPQTTIDIIVNQDLEIDALLVHIRQFIAPSTDLFAPWVLWRLLKFGLKKRLGKISANEKL